MPEKGLLPEIDLGPISHIQHWAQQKPNDKAISSAEKYISWAELLSLVYEVQNEIEKLDLQPGSGVLVSADPLGERVLTLGVLQAGLKVATFNGHLDRKSLSSAGFETLISLNGETKGSFANHVEMPLTFGATVREWDMRPRVFENRETLRVVFSSGTTGSPKGVPISAEVLFKRITAAREHYMALSPYLTTVSFSTVAGNSSLFLDIWRGHEHLVGGSAQENLWLIEQKKVKGLMGSPSSLEMLHRSLNPSIDVSSVDTIYSAGSFIRPKLASALESSFDATTVNIYGSTEAGLVGWNHPTSEDTSLDLFPGVECKITQESDSNSGKGMIAIKTPYLADGYLNQDETQESFVDGYFIPGDIGQLTKGKLYLFGRADDLINLNGEKIDPIPIENYVRENFDVDDVACVLAEDRDGKSFHLMVVVSQMELDLRGIQSRLYSVYRTHAPQQVRVVTQLPRNEMGKVLRRALLRKDN